MRFRETTVRNAALTHGSGRKMENSVEKTKDNIVVGVDGSDSSKEALRWAAKLAPAMEAEINAIVAWEYPIMWGAEGNNPDWWHPDEDAKTILQESITDVFGSTPPSNLVGRISQGRPTNVLLEASAKAKMLIVGSRGHGGFAGLLLGSVSSTCAEHAKCPVLIIHGAGDEH